MKTCSRCGKSKDPSEFGKDVSSSDGLKSGCRACKSVANRDYRNGKVGQGPQDTFSAGILAAFDRSKGLPSRVATVDRDERKTQRIALIGCAHVDDGNTIIWSWAVERLKELRPTKIRLMGDFLSIGPLSHWPKLTPSFETYKSSIERAKSALDQLQAIAPVDYLFGNHEDWVEQYCAMRPEMAGHVDVAENLNLKGRGVQHWTSYQPVVEPWGIFHHGHATKSNAYRWYAEQYAPAHGFKLPVWIAHFHSLGAYDAPNGVYCEGTGYLGAFRPAYIRAGLPAWAWGFRVIDIDQDRVVGSTAVRYQPS